MSRDYLQISQITQTRIADFQLPIAEWPFAQIEFLLIVFAVSSLIVCAVSSNIIDLANRQSAIGNRQFLSA